MLDDLESLKDEDSFKNVKVDDTAESNPLDGPGKNMKETKKISSNDIEMDCNQSKIVILQRNSGA